MGLFTRCGSCIGIHEKGFKIPEIITDCTKTQYKNFCVPGLKFGAKCGREMSPSSDSAALFRTKISCSSLTQPLIIWQDKSERSDWFFLGQDFAIRTVSMETVISCVFFVFESR